MKVAITGANGEIGRVLTPYLARQHEVRLATWDMPAERSPPAQEESWAGARRVDIRDAAAVSAFVLGADAVIHLAAEREVDAGWDRLRGPNIDGTFNVFDACARQSVRKVVFASSSHVTGGYGLAGERGLDGMEAVRPDSLYGVTKAFGEALGRFTADRYGISVICLRLGWFLVAPHNEESMRMWLSPGDLCRLVAAALLADVRYGIYYGASANARGPWDLRPAIAELGYQPQDDSQSFADHLARRIDSGT